MSAPGPEAILRRAAELTAQDRPFALATVVAVRRPTSARPGAHGIIHPDRTVEGWVGGSCARPVVIKEALRSIEDGQPRLLRLSPNPAAPSEGIRADGVIEHLMTCHSGGTLEIFVEPHLPAPALWIAGVTPLAAALAELGAGAGFRVTIADPDAGPDAFPGADRVLDRSDLAGLDPDARPYVVVATQGQWDEEAVQAALARDPAPAYLGLVASPKRAAVIREYLAGQGIAAERIARLKAPAGLDIGAETPEEIAISILAELVTVRRAAASDPLVAVGPGRPAERAASAAAAGSGSGPRHPIPDDVVLRDPVCGMTVDRDDVRYVSRYGGVTYAFCRLPCRTEFLKDPEAHLHRAPAAHLPRSPTERTAMHFSGTVEIKAPRTAVWDFLIDPVQVGSCGPGVESVEIVDDTHYKARAKVSVGPVTARFNVDLEAGEQVPPDRATIKAHGMAPGTAVDGTGTMRLRDAEDGTTIMDWETEVAVSGTIASLGMRLLEGTAKKMIGQTFECIRAKLESAAVATA